MNFVDLTVIAEFSEYYYTITAGDRLSKLINSGSLALNTGSPITLKDLLEIETTTSVVAKSSVKDKNKLKEAPFSQINRARD